MRHQTNDSGWNPYVAGALTGVLIVLSVWLTGKYAGVSTSFVRTVGMLEQLVAPDRVAAMAYFLKTVPKIEWQWMFVVGIFFGALLASLASGSFTVRAVPAMWESRFGPVIGKRALFAFTGGFVSMFGARLAGGCPSGHGLSGSLQLAVSSLIALACFFAGGILMAKFLYAEEVKE